MKALVYGKEHTFLDEKTGLLFRNSTLKQTAPLHTHTFYEIFIVTQGSALHLINETIQTITKGDMVFIRPKDTHTYEFYCSDDFTILNLGFTPMMLNEISSFLGIPQLIDDIQAQELPPYVKADEEERNQIIKTLLEVGELMKTMDYVKTMLFAKSTLVNIITHHFLTLNQSTSPYPIWMERMLKEMQKVDNLREGYSKMLELSSCSSSHLSRVFRSYTGLSPVEYINNKRLEYSIYLLTQTKEEILAISMECGFSSLSHYYHLFARRYHTSPDKFRKQAQSPSTTGTDL